HRISEEHGLHARLLRDLFEEGHHRPGHPAQPGDLGGRRVSEARQVDGHDPAELGEGRRHGVPIVRRATETMDQDDGRALPSMVHAMQTRGVELDVAAHNSESTGASSVSSPAGKRGDHVSQVLAVDGLRKSFGDLVAVDGVGFHVESGETYGLLGPNGAGKTTTISMIAGLLAPDAGKVVLAGEEISVRSTRGRNRIGFVPQDLAIYPDLTCRENLVFFGRLYGLGGDLLKSRVDEVLEVIGLTDRADDLTKEFSGGMKRRLNIGIGLLHEPTLLILDEPTVGVDPQSRNAILTSVENLSSAGMAVLYTTHYMEEAERLCDRVGIIDEGTIKAEGTRRSLVA